MPTLAARDYKAVLDFVEFAGEVAEPDPFAEPVLEKLREVIPCEAITYGDYAGPTTRRRNIRAAPRDVVPVSATVARAADELRSSYPTLLGISPPGRALRVTDVMTRKQYRSSPLYALLARPLGIEYSMNLTLADGGRVLGSFGFDASGRDFGERDRDVLEVLTPHLVRLHRAARPTRDEILTSREREILHLVADGCTNRQVAGVLGIAVGTVDKHLDNAYAKLGVSSRAAAVAALFR